MAFSIDDYFTIFRGHPSMRYILDGGFNMSLDLGVHVFPFTNTEGYFCAKFTPSMSIPPAEVETPGCFSKTTTFKTVETASMSLKINFGLLAINGFISEDVQMPILSLPALKEQGILFSTERGLYIANGSECLRLLSLVYDDNDRLMLSMQGDSEDTVCTHPRDIVIDAITCGTVSFLKAKIRPVPIIFDHGIFLHNHIEEDGVFFDSLCTTNGEYLRIDDVSIKDNGIPTGSSI